MILPKKIKINQANKEEIKNNATPLYDIIISQMILGRQDTKYSLVPNINVTDIPTQWYIT